MTQLWDEVLVDYVPLGVILNGAIAGASKMEAIPRRALEVLRGPGRGDVRGRIGNDHIFREVPDRSGSMIVGIRVLVLFVVGGGRKALFFATMLRFGKTVFRKHFTLYHRHLMPSSRAHRAYP